MIQNRSRFGRRRTGRAADTRLEMDWAGRLSTLLGACEEFQSSRIGLALLNTAIDRDPRLAAVLQSSLAEMRQAEQALRQEALGLLDRLAALIDETRPASRAGPPPTKRPSTTKSDLATRLFLAYDLDADHATRHH
ncbi:hypothetical protein ABC977_16210 [Thioalkalicoccus limnaeus]|uniref:Uncharacterized protein n=1 Tax=Thioalkalicoccus limnaeus TaxID=120681 RepID=A0ABV4BHF8_9GAMM